MLDVYTCRNCKLDFSLPGSGGACPFCASLEWYQSQPSYSSPRGGGADVNNMQGRTFSFGNPMPQQQQYPQQGFGGQAQHQAPQGPPMEQSFAGYIENAEQKQGGRGPFFKLTIGGRVFNVFSDVDISGLNIGTYVQGTFVEKPNNYGTMSRSVRSIQPFDAPAGAPAFNPQQQQSQPSYASAVGSRSSYSESNSKDLYWEDRALRDREKDLHVRREACWNISNNIVANFIAAGFKFADEKAFNEVTRALAHEIENDVARPDAFQQPTHNPAPGATGVGNGEAVTEE